MTALKVCSACKGRKKKCDKRTPRCSFCVLKNIDCCYDYGEVSGPYKKFRSFKYEYNLDPGSHSLLEKEKRTLSHSQRALQETLNGVALARSALPAALGSDFAVEALQIIRATHRSLKDIGASYFNTLHRWVPFFCPYRFEEILANFESSPTPEVSLLLLCMSLLTYDRTQAQSPLLDHGTMYLHTKTIFTRVQIQRKPCIHLIHAGIFISIYEYACKRLDQALATIDICARMAYNQGLHHKPSLPVDSNEWNTWWAIRIFERTFYCEVSGIDPPMITSAPHEEDWLPSEVSKPGTGSGLSLICLITPENLAEAGCFGRAALATYLLDRVIQVARDPPATTQLSTLIQLDIHLQNLLFTTMDKCHGKRGGHCGAVGISIRALFLLHRHFLQLESEDARSRCRDHSQAAIRTAAQIVLDIARSQKEAHLPNDNTLAPVLSYLYRYTLEYLYETRYEDHDLWFEDSDVLRQGLDELNRRWPEEPCLSQSFYR